MITAAREADICSALRAAGARWPAVARALPEFARLGRAKPPGPGMGRAWVLLNGEHERHDMPVRLLQHENGVWFPLGTYIHEIEEIHHGQA